MLAWIAIATLGIISNTFLMTVQALILTYLIQLKLIGNSQHYDEFVFVRVTTMTMTMTMTTTRMTATAT